MVPLNTKEKWNGPFLVGTGPYEVHTWPSSRFGSVWFIHNLPLCTNCTLGTRQPCPSPGYVCQTSSGEKADILQTSGSSVPSTYQSLQQGYKFFLRFIYFMCVHACLHAFMWERMVDHPELELWLCVATWVLGTKPGSSADETCAPNCWVNCLAPTSKFCYVFMVLNLK